MKLLTEELYKIVEEETSRAKSSLLIISPYIKKEPTERIIDIVKNKNLDLKIVTLPPGEEYITGATDLEAIQALQNNGFNIKMLPSLHAKIYLIDENTLLLGSANFTNNGLGLSNKPKKEILKKRKQTKTMLTLFSINYGITKKLDQLKNSII